MEGYERRGVELDRYSIGEIEGIVDTTHQANERPRQYWELPYHEDERCTFSAEQLFGPVLKDGEPVIRRNGEPLMQNDAFCMNYWMRCKEERDDRFWRLRHYVLHCDQSKLRHVQNELWRRYKDNHTKDNAKVWLTRKQMDVLMRIISARR